MAKICDLGMTDILLCDSGDRVLNSDGTTSSTAGAVPHEGTIPANKTGTSASRLIW